MTSETQHLRPSEVFSRTQAAWLVALLTLGALALRLVNLDYLLPHEVEPDAVIVWQAASLDRPAGVLEDERTWLAPFYPHLLAWLLHFLPGSGYTSAAPADAPLAEHLAAASLPYIRARALIAVLSVLAIPAVYLVARRFLARPWALVAAAFMATSLLAQAYGQQARPHAASTSLSLMAVVAALRVERKPSFANHALVASITFLALGCLHNGVFALPSVVLALWIAGTNRLRGFALLAVASAASIALFYPFFLFQQGVVGAHGQGELSVGGQILSWEYVTPTGFVSLARGLSSYDPLLVVLAALGVLVVIAALVRRAPSLDRRALLVVAAFPLSFIAFWGWMRYLWPRFTIPLVPYAALLASVAAAALLPRLMPASLAPRARRVGTVVLALACLAVPAFACVKLALLRARDDPQELAARWLDEHAEREQDVVAVGVHATLPLLMSPGDVHKTPSFVLGVWERYCLVLPAEASARAWRLAPVLRPGLMRDKLLAQGEVRAVVDEERATLGVVVPPTMNAVDKDETRDAFRALGGEPAAAWHPFDLARREISGSGYELGYFGFERVIGSSLWGQPVEIYRFPPR